MRIALIGDLQYGSAEAENLSFKMEQIAKLCPDFAVVMGDFGGPDAKSVTGYEKTRELVSALGCPWHAILGNHDVEYVPGRSEVFDSVGAYAAVYGKEPYLAFEANGVLILCITVEPQPEEGMRTVNAVYVSDRQFVWAKEQLDAHPGMPAIIIAHAPIAGSGLRCLRPLHTASLDTYLDQTYDAARWHELIKKYPQIKAWCSAHYHMGHDYDTAITERDGVVHISCGVITECSRDGSRHTRILDITDDKTLVISTLDHNDDSELKYDAEVDLSGCGENRGRIAAYVPSEILLGYDNPKKIWRSEKLGRCYVSTENGFLWEYDCALGEFLGAIFRGQAVDKICVAGDRLVMDCVGGFASVGVNAPSRWDCIGGFAIPERRGEAGIYGEELDEIGFSSRMTKEGLYVKLDC